MTILIALVCLVAGCAAPRHSLTILHTNDIHGKFMPERATWRDDSAFVGGFAALSGALDSVRAADKETIYLDAGDLMTGNPICNIIENGVEGGALLELLNLCGCNATCLGNHEFDLGAEHLRKFAARSDVPILCANVRELSNGTLLCPASQIIERGGLRVGVIGLILTDLAGVVSAKAIAPFDIGDIAQTAQPLIDELDPLTDVIILLTHNGVDDDKELARVVHGCDVIIGGHSHTRLKEPIVENGVIIAQTGSYLKNLGVLKLNVRKDRVESHTGALVELVENRFVPRPEVFQYCARFTDQIEREYGDTIAIAAETWSRSYNESSPLGNLLCDLLRDGTNADFALINSGGIRKDLRAGPVRKLDIVEALPFTNSVVRFEVTSAEIAVFARKQVEAQVGGKQEVLQMSGLTISYVNSGGAPTDVQIAVNGTPLDSARTYTGVSIDYVLQSQYDKYLGFQPRKLENVGVLLSDFIITALERSAAPVSANSELRLIQR